MTSPVVSGRWSVTWLLTIGLLSWVASASGHARREADDEGVDELTEVPADDLRRPRGDEVLERREEGRADEEVGRGEWVCIADPPIATLGGEVPLDGVHEDVRAQGRTVDLGHEPAEEGRLREDVGEHRKRGGMEPVRAGHEAGEARFEVGWGSAGRPGLQLSVERADEALEPPDERRQDEIVLVGEVVVEDAVRDAGFAGDVARRDGRRLALRDEGLRRNQQPAPELEGSRGSPTDGPGGGRLGSAGSS
jgi:hypothetical protein